MRHSNPAAPVTVSSVLSVLPTTPASAAMLARTILAILTALAVQTATARAQTTTVSPADRALLEGSSSTSYPLGRYNCRYQQLYGDIGGPRMIKGQRYRRDALGKRGQIKSYRTDLEISMSATTQGPSRIHRTFADNIGANPTRVLDRSWVSFPTTDKPASVPASFEYRIPYLRPYRWDGKGSLVLDMTIHGNLAPSGPNRDFSASLDSHHLYAGGRNVQPGYRFGSGCRASGATTSAWCAFELRHEGSRLDLAIDSRWGVPTSVAGPAGSLLLLSSDAKAFRWPPGSGCLIYGRTEVALGLPGDNSTSGAYKAVIGVGAPPPVYFEMYGQILSYARHSGEAVASDASRLIAPPAGRGIVSSRLIHPSDRSSPTGTVSTVVPVSLFF